LITDHEVLSGNYLKPARDNCGSVGRGARTVNRFALGILTASREADMAQRIRRILSIRISITALTTVAGIIAAAMPCFAQEQTAGGSAAQNPIANQVNIPIQNDLL
jgi:hypothetical protein